MRFAVWLVAMLLVVEGAVRSVGFILGRDGAAHALPHADGGIIYCVGDSFTYGQGVRREEAWPRLLAKRLRDALGTRSPEVRVLAQPGRSSSGVLVEVDKVLKRGDARLVLVMTGWNANDADFAQYATDRGQAVPVRVSIDLFLEHSRLYRVAKHALTYRELTLVLNDVKIVPLTHSMSLYSFRTYQEIGEKNLAHIARLCRAAAVKCVFLTYPHRLLPPNPYSQSEYYHTVFGRTVLTEEEYILHNRRPGEIAIDAVIRDVASRENVPLIDLQPGFEGLRPEKVFQEDLHHPTASGHELIAETVFEALQRVTTD